MEPTWNAIRTVILLTLLMVAIVVLSTGLTFLLMVQR